MNKTKKSAHSADINVVCELSLEAMLHELEAMRDATTQVLIEPVDDDLARFRLVHVRDGRGTASVTGQVRRWADSMSHVVCDGDAIQPYRWQWRRWLLVGMAFLVSLPLVAITSGDVVFGLMGLLMYVGLGLGTLTLVSLFELWQRVDWNSVPEKRFAAHQTGIPHYKDRERLLQKIVTCVKASEAAQRLTPADTASDPVSSSHQESSLRERK